GCSVKTCNLELAIRNSECGIRIQLFSSSNSNSKFQILNSAVLLRKCDGLLSPRTCQAAIAPPTMNAKAAKVAKLSTTCKRESRDQVSRGSGSLRDLSGLCVHPCCTRLYAGGSRAMRTHFHATG